MKLVFTLKGNGLEKVNASRDRHRLSATYVWPVSKAPAPRSMCSRERKDADWHLAAQAYLNAKAEADASDARLEATRQALVALAKHPKEAGAGVTVTRFWKQGNVDYKKVVELKGVDLNPYRGKAREEVRVSLLAA